MNDNYSKQLKDTRWITKRNVILFRDNFNCQKCLNIEILNKSAKGKIIDLVPMRSIKLALNQSNPKYKPEYKVHFTTKQNVTKTLSINTYYYKKQIANQLSLFTGSSIYYQESVKLILIKNSLGDNTIANYINNTIITAIKFPDNFREKWFYVSMLNVHHKFYDKNLKAWEYPDSALITLCEYCHKMEHGL